MKKFNLILVMALNLCLVASSQEKESMAEFEAMKAQAKVEEQNKGIVHDFFKAIDEGNVEKIMELVAFDFNLTAPGLNEQFGRVKLVHHRNAFYEAFPDTIHIIDELIAEGDKVAVRLHINATHEADYEGIPATGKKVTQYGMHMIRVVDGEIKEMWSLEDTLGLMQQLRNF